MKTLIYTCNDFKNYADKCLELLHSSLLIKNEPSEFDFLVLTNNENYNTTFNVIYDDEFPEIYAGFLKYSNKIPEGYDYYIYLDSDILFNEKIENILPENDFQLCVAEELNGKKIIESDWHCLPGLPIDLINLAEQNPCFNAGQFCFKAKTNFINLCNLFVSHLMSNDKTELARLEQCCFNTTCLLFLNKLDHTKMTPITTINPEGSNENKTIFHFTGFNHTGMNQKYQRMINFAQEYNLFK